MLFTCNSVFACTWSEKKWIFARNHTIYNLSCIRCIINFVDPLTYIMLSVDGKLISISLKLSSSRLPRFKYIPVQVMRTNINDVKISKHHIIVLRTSYTYVLYYNNIVLIVLLYTEYYHKNNDSTWTRRYSFFHTCIVIRSQYV